jgi:hypothetical protein
MNVLGEIEGRLWIGLEVTDWPSIFDLLFKTTFGSTEV